MGCSGEQAPAARARHRLLSRHGTHSLPLSRSLSFLMCWYLRRGCTPASRQPYTHAYSRTLCAACEGSAVTKPIFFVLCAIASCLSRAQERKRLHCSARVISLQGFLFQVANSGDIHNGDGVTVHSCGAV